MTDARRAIEAVWRIESPKLIASIARVVRDAGLAEDVAQDALVAALTQWPRDGVPDNPGAWLMTTAKRRAIDWFRRDATLHDKYATLAAQLEAVALPEPDEDLGDDVLRLMFIACHPVLSDDARVALTLRMIGGLTTEEIARAFLASPETIAQRIVRAKRTLSRSGVPFELPPPNERAERLGSVLAVIYLIFNEGYAATAGEDWMRPELCHDAIRLGRVLAAIMSREPEVLGLVALMEIQASRLRARTGPDGEPVRLLDQDRGRWDWMLIGRALEALARAERLGGTRGPYLVQASIAACHARARTATETDWHEIVRLYDELLVVAPSAVVELNRAVAVGMAHGAEAGLAAVDSIDPDRLDGYHLLASVRGHLLQDLGRIDEARDQFRRAAKLTSNEQERDLLLARADAVQEPTVHR